ncbi:MAG: phosphate signaling complex protein PhoU [Chloroflexi bacterium]|nr:phosphate signaling complex protein PhoU [Chloroflexota bacterium]MDA1147638.1 phosphate signaling complex protein PhoU [Chloroflexota bacterium]
MVTPEPQPRGELRERFHRQLSALQDRALEMTSMVDRAIERSVEALINRDVALARVVIDEDQVVNETGYGIHDMCVALIAQQSPLAGDLRLVMSVTAIATDLERMGDHAEGIARIVVMMQDEPLVKPLVDIPIMAEKARQMMNNAVQAFVDRDTEAAFAVGRADDEVDELYNTVYADLIGVMVTDQSTIEAATHLLWVAHNLERIGDRATNIAERTVYTVTGELPQMDASYY